MTGILALTLLELASGGAILIAPPSSPTTLTEISALVERETGERLNMPPGLAGRLIFARWSAQPAERLVPGLAYALGLSVRHEPAKKRWVLTAPPVDPILIAERNKDQAVTSQFLAGVKDFVFSNEEQVLEEYDRVRLIYNTFDKTDAQSAKGQAYRLQIRALGTLQNHVERPLIGLLSWLPLDYLTGRLGTRLDERARQWFTYSQLPAAYRAFIPAELRPGGASTMSAAPIYCVEPAQEERNHVEWKIECVLPRFNSRPIGTTVFYEGTGSALNAPLDLKNLAVSGQDLTVPDAFKGQSGIDQRRLPALFDKQGLDYAAWCRPFSLSWPSLPPDLTYRWLCENAQVKAFFKAEYPSVHVLFRQSGSWLGLVDRVPYVPATRIDWTRHLPMLRQLEKGPVSLAQIQRHFLELSATEVTTLTGAEYEQGSFTPAERSLSVGSGLFRAACLYLYRDKVSTLSEEVQIELDKAPANVRDMVLIYLRHSRSQMRNKEYWRSDFTFDGRNAKLVLTPRNNLLTLTLQMDGVNGAVFTVPCQT